MLGLFQLIECRKICIVRHWILQQKTGVYTSFVFHSELVYLCYDWICVYLQKTIAKNRGCASRLVLTCCVMAVLILLCL